MRSEYDFEEWYAKIADLCALLNSAPPKVDDHKLTMRFYSDWDPEDALAMYLIDHDKTANVWWCRSAYRDLDGQDSANHKAMQDLCERIDAINDAALEGINQYISAKNWRP